jgi:DNA recombination protein RmuC
MGAGGAFIYFNKKMQNLSVKNEDLAHKNIHLKVSLEEKIKSFEAQIELINTTKTQMSNDFKAVASDILEKDRRNLSLKNSELLTPLTTQLKDFRHKIEDLSSEQAKDRSVLQEQIKTLSAAHENTLKGAEKLTNALTFDNKKQGDWGEMILESILDDSGLTKNKEYHTQTALRDGENNLFKPDVVVHLPDDKDIIIDSKVSLKHYQDYVSGDSAALVQHLKSIDTHIKNISLKSYENLHGVNTLDYIFVFFPIEASLLVALEQKPDLFNDALKKNVALVSPSTLMMSLKTINHIWNTERQNKNTEEIVRQAGKMYDKFAMFMESMKGINDALNAAQKKYDTAYNQLSSGKGNLIRKTELLKELGVQSKKELKP